MKRLSKASRTMILISCLAVVVLLSGLGVAMAQNFNLAPRYGVVNLAPGFMPDPHTISLTAGGNINTRTTGPAPACGFVANAPDVRLNWSGGSTLNIYAIAATDTTLLINTAGGQWLCNDDGGSGTNPLLSIPNATSGQYDIYVGTYNSSTTPARLRISELAPQWN